MYRNRKQEVLIHKTFGCYRFIYNYFLNKCKEKGFQKAYDLCKELRKLEKKYEWLKEVDTYYPSSKTCSRCGYKTEIINQLSIRSWECEECGNRNDRDINSSINILLEGLRFHYGK